MKTLEFSTSLSREIVIEAFRDEFGDFEEARKGTGQWVGWLEYTWPDHPLYLLANEDSTNQRFHCLYQDRGVSKRVNKVKGLLVGEDLWLVRRVLSSYLDPKRETKNRERFRNKLLIYGMALTASNIVLAGLGFLIDSILLEFIGFYLGLVDFIAIGLVWIIYRIGMTDDAFDLRILSIAFFYAFLVNGVPFSLIAIFLGSIVPVQGELSWIIFPVVLLLFLTSTCWAAYIVDPRLQPMLRREWSEMHVDAVRSSEPDVYEMKPLVANLWAAAFISYPRALTPSNWFIAMVLLVTWAFRLLGDSWFFLLFTIPVLVIWFSISWDMGLEHGFNEAAKKLKETGPYEIHIGHCELLVNFGIKAPDNIESV